MKSLLMQLIKNWFTERDGQSYCIARALGTVAGCAAIYKFMESATPDFQAFSLGIAAIIAAIAFKNTSEKGG